MLVDQDVNSLSYCSSITPACLPAVMLSVMMVVDSNPLLYVDLITVFLTQQLKTKTAGVTGLLHYIPHWP